MSQFISKIKKLPTNVSEKVIKHSREAQTLLMLLLMNPMYSRAAGKEDIMREALDVFFNIFGYVGVFLLVAGFVTLVSAIRQEDGDRQQKAIVSLVIAGVMIGLKVIVAPIINNTGVIQIQI